MRNFFETTIKRIKCILEWEFDCEKDEIKLQHRVVRLDDENRCLSDYNIRNKDKLRMCLLLRGGHIPLGRISFTNRIIIAGGDSAEGIKRWKYVNTDLSTT